MNFGAKCVTVAEGNQRTSLGVCLTFHGIRLRFVESSRRLNIYKSNTVKPPDTDQKYLLKNGRYRDVTVFERQVIDN